MPAYDLGRVFLSGPMTGIEDFNFPAFNEAAATLRSRGHEVWNPAEIDGGKADQPRAYYLRKDIIALCDCDSLVLLPGWKDSDGAVLEKEIADQLGLGVFYYPNIFEHLEKEREHAARV